MFKSGKEGRSERNESIETIRRQAQYRLVGTAILVTIAVISFSLLFDTAPRSLPVDMPIAIPAKDKVAPITPVPTTPVAAAKPAVIDERFELHFCRHRTDWSSYHHSLLIQHRF